MPSGTILDLLQSQAHLRPDSSAILGLERPALSYGHLYEHVQQTVQTLHRLGVGRFQRVGLIVPPGPELATAQLSVSSCATVVPLSPGLQAAECRAYFPLLKLDRLIVLAGAAPEARTVASECGIPLIDLCPGLPTNSNAEAGLFTLAGDLAGPAASMDMPQAEDIAMVFLSSGTTSRPKIVPKTQQDILGTEVARAKFLGQTDQDRALNVLPLWFAGGQGEFIRTMITGGSLVCTPGFDGSCFFEWLDRFQPTVFMATASMYRAIMAHVPTNQDILHRHSLHYLVTGGMATPPALLDDLEGTFGIPVLQLYAATEIYTITMSPLPPKVRKRDSVGVVIQGEIGIFDADGKPLGPGEVGEVRFRGPNVFKGYEGDPAATQAAFADGWYVTGDLGYLDADGYLFVTGRLKEVISRGGEKIAPQEIESVLSACPGVAEVAAFGVPDPHLGEEVAVAIVAKPGTTLSKLDIRNFAAARLAASKIPRHIVFLQELPKTSVGKVKRLALAETVSVAPRSNEFVAPRTEIEQRLVELWADLLHRPTQSISIHARFRDEGGDSMAAARLVFRVREALGIMVTIVDLFDASTIAEQAQVLEQLRLSGDTQRRTSTLIPIRSINTSATRPPLFCMHALDGGVYFYQILAPLLPPDQPIYGLQGVGMDGTEAPLDRLEDIAARQVQEIRAVQMRGPYFLCGFSFGGRVALETGRILRDKYAETAYVFMIDDHIQINKVEVQRQQRRESPMVSLTLRLQSLAYVIFRLPLRYKLRYASERLNWLVNDKQARLNRRQAKNREIADRDALMPAPVMQVKQANERAAKAFVPSPYSGPLTYLRASDDEINIPFFRTWDVISTPTSELIDIPGGHWTLMDPQHVSYMATHLQRWLDHSREPG